MQSLLLEYDQITTSIMSMAFVFLLHLRNLIKTHHRDTPPPRTRGSISGLLPLPPRVGQGGGITSVHRATTFYHLQLDLLIGLPGVEPDYAGPFSNTNK